MGKSSYNPLNTLPYLSVVVAKFKTLYSYFRFSSPPLFSLSLTQLALLDSVKKDQIVFGKEEIQMILFGTRYVLQGKWG